MQLSQQQQQVRDILNNKKSNNNIKKIIDCLNDVLINSYNDENDRTYFSTNGRCLVIQEMDMKAMNDDGACSSSYHTAAGVIAGLNPSHSKYIKRVHIIVDSFEATYFANFLGDFYHYQIGFNEISDFLHDAVKLLGSETRVDLAGFGKHHELIEGDIICEVGKSETSDVVIYTELTPLCIAKGIGYARMEKDDSLEGNEIEETMLIVAHGCSNNERLKDAVSELPIDGFYSYLKDKSGEADDYGAAQRNQKKVISFGFNFLDVTDKTRGDLNFCAAPRVTTKYNSKPGLRADTTMDTCLTETMVSLTSLSDNICAVFGIEKFFNNNERNELFANTIHEDNRLEKLTVAITAANEKLPCHTDSQNGECTGYTGNIAHFKYIRNTNVSSPLDPDYYLRVYVGGYGRKTTGRTIIRAHGMARLQARLTELISSLPIHRTKYTANDVLVNHNDDLMIQPDIVFSRGTLNDEVSHKLPEDICVREPHLNKVNYYNFFVQILNEWIQKRRLAGKPVNKDELVQAVWTSQRCTTSPSTWASLFRLVTSDKGVVITLPSDLSVLDHVSMDEGKNLPRMMHYESPLPLWLQYIFLSISELGGVGKGSFVRFQQCALNKHIDLLQEERSVTRLVTYFNRLEKCTKTSDVSKAGTHVDNFISAIKQSEKNGGVQGIGDLLAFHMLGIFCLGGWVNPQLIFKFTRFSTQTKTAQYLSDLFQLSPKQKIIDPLASYLSGEFGHHHSKIIAENATCKACQQDGQGEQTRYEAVVMNSDSYLIDVQDTKLVALHGSEEIPITSGVVPLASLKTNEKNVYDLRVIATTVEPKVGVVASLFGGTEMWIKSKAPVVYTPLKKSRRKRKRCKPKQCLQERGKGTNWKRWGLLPSKGFFKLYARRQGRMRIMSIIQEYFYNVSTLVRNLPEMTSTDAVNYMLSKPDEIQSFKACANIQKEFEKWQEFVKMNPNEQLEESSSLHNENSIEYKAMIDKLRNGYPSLERRNTRSSAKNGDDDAYEGKIVDVSSRCISAAVGNQVRVLPRSCTLEMMGDKYKVTIDCAKDIKKILNVQDAELTYTQINWNGATLYQSYFKVGNVMYSSQDEVFDEGRKSPRRREVLNKDSFCIGRVKVDGVAHYETKTHSVFALVMVIYKKANISLEETFLGTKDICIVTPRGRFSYNLDNIATSTMQQLPICCILRTNSGILALDLDQMRFCDWKRCLSGVTTRGTSNKEQEQSIDLEREYINGDGLVCSLPSCITSYIQLKLSRHRERNNAIQDIVQYIDDSMLLNGNKLPVNTIQIQKNFGGDDGTNVFEKVPPGYIRLVVQHNQSNSRTDTYFQTPKKKYLLRSKKEVESFEKLLAGCNGNEYLAWERLKRLELERRQKQKQQNDA